MFRSNDFNFVGRHFFAGPPIDDGDLVRSQTNQSANTVDGRVAAADDHTLFADKRLFIMGPFLLPYGKIGEKINSGVTPLQIFALNAKGVIFPCADAQENSIISGCDQGADIEITSQSYVGFVFNPQIQNSVDFPGQYLLGESIFRNSVSNHTAKFGHGIENRNIMPQTAEKISIAQPGRTAADNGHFSTGGRRNGNRKTLSCLHFMVGHKAFQLVDGDRFVFDTPTALVFTRVRTDSAAGQQQGITLPNGIDRPFIISDFGLVNVFGYIDFCRTGLLAGGDTIVILIEMEQFLRHGFDFHDIFGTDFLTGPTADTFHLVDNRIPMCPNFNGIKSTGLDTIPKTQASHRTDPLAAVKGRKCPATFNSHIYIFFSRPVSAGAGVVREQRFCRTWIETHNAGDIRSGFRSGHNTDAGQCFPGHHGNRCSRTSGISTSPAIGSGRKSLYDGNARVFIYIKDLGRRTENSAACSSQSQHKQNG